MLRASRLGRERALLDRRVSPGDARMQSSGSRAILSSVRDTDPKTARRYAELLRAKSGMDRLAQAMSLSKLTRDMAIAGIRSRHPDLSEDELRIRLTVTLYGREAAIRLFGATNVPADAR